MLKAFATLHDTPTREPPSAGLDAICTHSNHALAQADVTCCVSAKRGNKLSFRKPNIKESTLEHVHVFGCKVVHRTSPRDPHQCRYIGRGSATSRKHRLQGLSRHTVEVSSQRPSMRGRRRTISRTSHRYQTGRYPSPPDQVAGHRTRGTHGCDTSCSLTRRVKSAARQRGNSVRVTRVRISDGKDDGNAIGGELCKVRIYVATAMTSAELDPDLESRKTPSAPAAHRLRELRRTLILRSPTKPRTRIR